MLTISGTLEDLMRDLPAIVATGVEVRVEVADIKPVRWPTATGRQWYLEKNVWDQPPESVPLVVWEHLKNPNNTDNLIYDTEEEARQDLSDGILAWAKTVAARKHQDQ